MMDAYIFDAIRSPRGNGKANKSSLHQIKPIELLSQLYTAFEQRTPIDHRDIESVILGCVGQIGDQGANIAKISTLYHGWGPHLEGITLNTFCTSALSAIGLAKAKINSGMNDLVIAGGIEMLSNVPMFADQGAWFADKEVARKSHFTHMGVAADLIATLEGFNEAELDAYVVQSHQRAAAATQKGYFSKSIIPIVNEHGERVLSVDENIRPNCTVEALQRFEALFAKFITPNIEEQIKIRYPQIRQLKHLHHVGNSPTMADGASLLLIGNLEKGKALGLEAKAKICAFDSTSCEPIIMLLGGQYSVQNAVKKAGLKLSDIDLHNFGEAFSATCLKYQSDLNVADNKFNVNGGTMTMGHAQGASGAMITTTLLEEMERRGVELGVAGISGGAGLGAGLVIERV
ncbi:MAG: acetyl-CoA C-acyltransferase [Bacteroidota bacterium]